jgi:hypothetical protein
LLITVAQAAVKEKVIRVIIATFRVGVGFPLGVLDVDVLQEFDHEGAFRKSAGHACRAASTILEEPLNPQVVRRGRLGGRTVCQR